MTPSNARSAIRGLAAFASLTLLLSSGCGARDGAGASGMFSWFGSGKPSGKPSVAAQEFGIRLTSGTAVPAAAPVTLNATCRAADRDGSAPAAGTELTTVEPGKGRAPVFVARAPGQPALAFVVVSASSPRFEIWELSADDAPRFVKRRDFTLEAAQAKWTSFLVRQVGCVGDSRLVVAVSAFTPRPAHFLYTYDIATNAFHAHGAINPNTGNYDEFFRIVPVSENSSVTIHHTGRTRIKAEVYYNEFDHLLFHSARHSAGVEFLKLGSADGSVQRAAAAENTLWLQTREVFDPAKPVDHVWSIDLTRLAQ
jgi:hypothetical protein